MDSDRPNESTPSMTDSPEAGERRYGRGGFLLLVAGGISSLAWAGPVSRALSPLTAGASQLVGNLLPAGGWRIYTISGSMPIFDPSSWRLGRVGAFPIRKPIVARVMRD